MSTEMLKHPDSPATEKQLDYLQALVVKHDIGMDVETFQVLLKTWIDNGIATRAFISGFIDQYLEMPLRVGVATYTANPPAGVPPVRPTYYRSPTKKAPPEVVDLGFYVTMSAALTETYYHVVKTRDGQRTYAKILHNDNGRWEWLYEPGAIKQAASGSKISIAQAAKWSVAHSLCFVCTKDHQTVKSATWVWPTKCWNTLNANNKE